MKNWKLSTLLSTPLGVVIVVAAVVLGIELLFMLFLHETLIPMLPGFSDKAWDIIDAVTLTVVVSPVLYFLVFRKMHEDEERLLRINQQINASTQDAIIVISEQGRITDWNPAAQKIFQYSREEALDQQMHQLIAPSRYHADIARGLSHFKETGEGLLIGKTREFVALRKDGSEFPIEVSISAMKLNGHWHALGIMRDITERKKTELALLRSEDNLNRAQAVARIGSWNLDIASNRLEWSAEANRIFGIPRQEPTDLDTFASTVHPDDREWVLKAWGEAVAGAPYDIEHRIVAGGEIRWVRERAMIERDAEGRALSGVGTVQDIAERKEMEHELQESEARYRRITEGLTDYQYTVLIENGRAVETTQSPACVTVTGYTAEEYAANSDLWIQMVVPEDRERVMKHMQQILAGNDCSPIEHRITRKNGETRWISDTSILFRDASGKLLSYDGVIKDITERKQSETAMQEMLKVAKQSRQVMLGVIEDQRRAEESLRQLNEELESKVVARTADLEHARHDAEQANQAKSSFLASMSHEIRTPMNGVIGMLDVLQQSSLKGSQVEMVNIIHDSAFALLTIINDILDFSKIEAGKFQIDSVSMSVADVVEGACETIDRMALKKEVELTLFTDPAIPAVVIGDPGRLRQILVNLVNNAIKFSSGQRRPGKVSVRVVLTESTPQQVTLEFRVTDNGIGMDAATQARLFTAFTQADSSTTRTYGGTGLGLAISRQLTEIMGGEIVAQSELGKGSMFSMHLSFALPTEKPATDDEASSLVADLPCLVVGDVGGIVDDFAAYLTHAGALVERVADLTAACEWIASQPLGLCIVIIDTADSKPSLEELRAAARIHPKQDTHFVVIGRGQRREPRLESADLVVVDGNLLFRRTLLKAVAIAAGRAKKLEREYQSGNVKTTLTPLSREEARRRGSLILIAEDNDINQKVILQQLKLLGHTADIANNGRDALERWQSGDYCILITDLHMPEMDGYELTVAIRAAETGKTRIPIIAFTANALKGEADHCRAVGMDDYLSKPVQLTNLKEMMEKWLPIVTLDSKLAATTSTKTISPIPRNIGKATPVDVNVLKALVGDDDATIRDFLHDFHINATKIADELRNACAAGQSAVAGAAAHKLKSSARSVGALLLGELCADMEKLGKVSDNDALAALLPKFEQELANVERFLDGY
ncbi:signal transduction histidine-protein kinase BarA [mine drainage metagenome]|uniref:histidine kinase n=1 Tax=mine drainage metagenome TaxID=410659 RepID=A0A1J5RJT0_9ZZZZ